MFQFFQKGLPLEELKNILAAETDPAMSSLALDDISLRSLEVKDDGDQDVVLQGERGITNTLKHPLFPRKN